LWKVTQNGCNDDFVFQTRFGYLHLCQSNPRWRIRNYDEVVETVGFEYGLDPESISSFVSSVNAVTVGELEEKINQGSI
jgi:hypothetical protein